MKYSWIKSLSEFLGISSHFSKNQTLCFQTLKKRFSKKNPFVEEMIYLLLALLNKDEKAIVTLSKLKSRANLFVPLLVIMDQISQSLTNGVYYAILCIFLKLSACELISRSLLPKTIWRKRVRLYVPRTPDYQWPSHWLYYLLFFVSNSQ